MHGAVFGCVGLWLAVRVGEKLWRVKWSTKPGQTAVVRGLCEQWLLLCQSTYESEDIGPNDSHPKRAVKHDTLCPLLFLLTKLRPSAAHVLNWTISKIQKIYESKGLNPTRGLKNAKKNRQQVTFSPKTYQLWCNRHFLILDILGLWRKNAKKNSENWEDWVGLNFEKILEKILKKFWKKILKIFLKF